MTWHDISSHYQMVQWKKYIFPFKADPRCFASRVREKTYIAELGCLLTFVCTDEQWIIYACFRNKHKWLRKETDGHRERAEGYICICSFILCFTATVHVPLFPILPSFLPLTPHSSFPSFHPFFPSILYYINFISSHSFCPSFLHSFLAVLSFFVNLISFLFPFFGFFSSSLPSILSFHSFLAFMSLLFPFSLKCCAFPSFFFPSFLFFLLSCSSVLSSFFSIFSKTGNGFYDFFNSHNVFLCHKQTHRLWRRKKEGKEECLISTNAHFRLLCIPVCDEPLSDMKIKNAVIHHIFMAFTQNVFRGNRRNTFTAIWIILFLDFPSIWYLFNIYSNGSASCLKIKCVLVKGEKSSSPRL